MGTEDRKIQKVREPNNIRPQARQFRIYSDTKGTSMGFFQGSSVRVVGGRDVGRETPDCLNLSCHTLKEPP